MKQQFLRKAWFMMCLLGFLAPCFMAESLAASKVAMVIGNKSYAGSPLQNPVNDATDMAASLKGLGFEVILVRDAALKEMEDAVRKFSSALAGAEVGVFFYAGHGVQADETNYLIPIKADIQGQTDFRYKAMDINYVMDQMEHAGSRLNIIILDACRNNPFRGLRGGRGGLGNMSGPEGSILAFATSPNKTAEDGDGRNGMYTKHILKNINTPGITIEEMFKRVLNGVSRDTTGRQTPWVNSSISDDFCFAGCVAPEDEKKSKEVERIRQDNERLAKELEAMRSEKSANALRLEELQNMREAKEKLENQLRQISQNEALSANFKEQLEALQKDKSKLEDELRSRASGDNRFVDEKKALLDQITKEKARMEEQLKSQQTALQDRDAKLAELESIQKDKERLEKEEKKIKTESKIADDRIGELEKMKIENQRLLESLRDRDDQLTRIKHEVRDANESRSRGQQPNMPPQDAPMIVSP